MSWQKPIAELAGEIVALILILYGIYWILKMVFFERRKRVREGQSLHQS